MKELQNVWILSATMDFNKDRYKQQIKMLTTYIHFQTSTNTRRKQEVKWMCLNGVTCRETRQVF